MTPALAADRIRAWFDSALRSVDPEAAVRRNLSIDGDGIVAAGRAIPVPGNVVIAAIGKAAVPMAHGAEAQLGDRIAAGIALTKDGHLGAGLLQRIQVREAAHPIPDKRGVRATTELLDLLHRLGSDDLVIALISGGGSALLEAPIDNVTLDDIAKTTGLMLRAGAPIDDLNAVRIPLSKVKGGGLRAAAGPARFATLILSDVLGNDPRVIASGPTVPSAATGEHALALLRRYGIEDRVPTSVIHALSRRPIPAPNLLHSSDVLEIIADNRIALDAFVDAARAEGVAAEAVLRDAQGEAQSLANEWVARLETAGSNQLLVGGGEATVTVRGDGIGGRNTEFVLAAALELERRGLTDWVVASLATDGQDGLTGYAGAMATSETPALARAAGIDLARALANNDSLAVFQATGGLVETGPTGTNVNDIYVAYRPG